MLFSSQYWDPKEAAPYFYNVLTEESRWERPTNAVVADSLSGTGMKVSANTLSYGATDTTTTDHNGAKAAPNYSSTGPASPVAKFMRLVVDAATSRCRPIVLTSMTTFVGLMPLMFNTSVQAQFLVPMAVSLSFGVLFATVITLLVVPSIYLLFEDLFALRDRMSGDSRKALIQNEM